MSATLTETIPTEVTPTDATVNGVATENKPAKAKKAKSTTKGKAVKAKAPKAKAAKKANKKPSKAKGSRPARDDAGKVARASDRFNTDQVRILRFLNGFKGKVPATRMELKVGVGMKPEALYSSKWLEALWALQSKKLIRIEESIKYTDQIRPQHVHSITDAGKEALKKAEADAKIAAKS